MFNTTTKETGKPVSIVLVQNQKEKNREPMLTPRISVYPNPVNKTFSVAFSIDKGGPVKVNIYNVRGQLVYTRIAEVVAVGKQVMTIDRDLSLAGIYILKIDAANYHESIAFVKE